MTRKDYRVVAAALRRALELARNVSECQLEAVSDAAQVVANELSADNPRFNEKLFLHHVFGDKV